MSSRDSKVLIGTVKEFVTERLQLILDLLYPARCPVCQTVLQDRRMLLCPDCGRKVRPPAQPRCMRCGKPLSVETELCRDCGRGKRVFTEGMGVFLYDEQMKASILRFKLNGHRCNARFYAEAMAYYGRERIRRWQPDLLVPVPMYSGDLRKRGYNQAALLAAELSGLTGIPWADSLVVKTEKTRSQKTLDAAGRRRNLVDAIRVTRSVTGLRILVVDDVFTTGSTVDVMA
ncbi:MAG: ComF family protein, partial [Blautia sp.]|nr:ComF family protein [Blautia sp.]